MNRQKHNLWLLLAVIAGLTTIYVRAPQGLYTFHGHGRLLRDALILMYWSLCVTHSMFAGIMWTQRGEWCGAETSTFRFVSVKAILWGFLALTAPPRNGIPLPYAYLLVIIELTTLDVSIQLIRRYVLKRKENES